MIHLPGNTQEDKLLVDRILSGDKQAFAQVIRNSERTVAHIVFKMIKNEEDRKDIAQDIYLKAYKKLSSFRFESRLSTWVARIAYNTCKDELRKRKPESHDFMPDETGDHRVTAIDGENSFADTENRELAGLLFAEIEKLSPVSRTLISLYHNAELTYEEIGQITGMPPGTVKSYLFRARKALKNNLLAEYKKEDL